MSNTEPETKLERFINDHTQHAERAPRQYSSQLEKLAAEGVEGIKGASDDLIAGIASYCNKRALPITEDEQGRQVINEAVDYRGHNDDWASQEEIRVYLDTEAEATVSDEETRLIAQISFRSPIKDKSRRSASYSVFTDGRCVGLVQGVTFDEQHSIPRTDENISFQVKEETALAIAKELRENCY